MFTSNRFKWFQDSDGCWLAINVNRQTAERICAEVLDKEMSVEIKQHRKRRSLDSNAYFWILADKLAQKLSVNNVVVSKTDIYRRLIPDVPGSSDIVCVQNKALDKLVENWQSHGLGWLTETMPSKIDSCTNVVLYYGSSVYDNQQMSRLIDLLVTECKEQGVETLPPRELAAMMETEHG